MRVGLLSQWYDPEPGGGALPAVLATGLAARAHDVKVLTGFPNYPQGTVYPGYRQAWRHLEHPRPGVIVRRAPLYASHNNNPVARAANYLSFGATAGTQALSYLADRDALWVYNSPAPVGAVARQLTKRRAVPFLLHIMDMWPDSVLDSGLLSSGAAHRVADQVLSGVLGRTYEAASLIAVTSRGQRDLLVARGVTSDRILHIPVWADESVFFPRPLRRELLPPEARDAHVVVMYAGAMGHVQRLDTALQAAAAVGPDVHLIMVGSGVAEAELRRLAIELSARNVHFLGRQPPSAMGDLAAAADVHLVALDDTPLWRMTMPSKVQSVMALGRPILGTCAGDAAAVVAAAGAGTTVMPGDVAGLADALRALVADRAQLASWGAAARRYYEAEFAQDIALTRVEAALASVAR